MSEKIYLLLLILCGTLSQGIIAASSDDDIRESSDLLLREKRVVNLDNLEHIFIEQTNYMVTIKEGSRSICAGVILSKYTVITALLCVHSRESTYRVISGTAYAYQGVNHTVTSKLTNSGNPPHGIFDGIALVNVEPPFVFNPKVGSINLYTGPLPAGTQTTVTGWGNNYPLVNAAGISRKLRQINLPIMDHRHCEYVYQGHFPITYKHICTFHERQYCARTDLGAPLVVNNMLAGIHVSKPEIECQLNPDIFVNLQLVEYRVWIRDNVRYY